ncbi:MAG: hypothetical protein AAF434_18270 [Pseudomonadota bacterium]
MKKIVGIGLVLILLFAKMCLAHDNAELEMDEKGFILEIPEYVQPVKFDVVTRTFQAKNLEMTIPECMDQYFVGEIQKIRGTWFHHQTDVPPHVVFTWSDENSGVVYNIPFSLLSAKPMYVVETTSVDQKMDDGKKIEIDKSCQDEINRSVREIDV